MRSTIPGWKRSTTGEKPSGATNRRLKPAPSRDSRPSWRLMKKRSSPRWKPTTPPVRRICHGSTPRNPTVSPRPVWILAKPIGHALSTSRPISRGRLSPPCVLLLAVSRQTQSPSPQHGWRCHTGSLCGRRDDGRCYRTYTGATSVMRGAVFGRKAGSDAANRFARANTV